MPTSPLTRRNSFVIFLLVWALSATYLGLNLNRGWVPHDEGILGQSAERVLNGEVPHRDFDEPYTGGLAYLDAASFHLFGTNLMVLRWVLFAFFLAWVPAVFGIAREFCSPWPAAGLTLLAVAWSVPNYPAAMPSWYCLFFTSFGVLTLLRYLCAPHPAWLFAAGLCGGLSFLVKSPGLYYVAGVLLFLVFHEQQRSRVPAAGSLAPTQSSLIYVIFVRTCLVLFLVVLARMVMPRGGASELVHFALPALAISGLLAGRERGASYADNLTRFRRLFALVLPFLAGVIVPALFLVLFYWGSGALRALFTGLFINQLRRLTDARLAPPHWLFELLATPMAWFVLRKRSSSRFSITAAVLQILAALTLLLVCRKSVLALLVILDSVRAAVPLLTALIAVLLYYRQKKRVAGIHDQRLMLLVSVVALMSLVQFPYAGPLYFCYFAALFFLMLAALLSILPQPMKLNLIVAGTFLALFAIFLFRPASIAAFEFDRLPAYPRSPLNLPRAGDLRVFDDEAARYRELIPFVASRAAGKPILAGPDCPQIYFLSSLRNPTPLFFDFFEPPEQYQTYMQKQLDRPDFIKVLIVNNSPAFSRPYRDILRSLARSRFSQSRKFDNFEVFWRP